HRFHYILTAGWGGGKDANLVGLRDLTGFQLTNISILPHAKPAYAERLEEYAKKADYPVMGLTDDEALFVNDAHYEKITI
ncbi:MAG: hypothetical protein AAB915_02130, partial [Patescibacteria group bacterium]